MTTKYFAFIDGSQQGPFELEELKEAGVHPSTYVWCKGMDDWQRADSVEEIRNLFKKHLEHRAEETATVKHIEADFQPDKAEPQDTPPPPDQIRFGRIPASVEPEPDINTPPQVSMTLAVLSLLLCFPPSGIAAVVFASKAQKRWEEALKSPDENTATDLKKKAHEYERQAKMWLGLTVAFGIIFWTILFSVK